MRYFKIEEFDQRDAPGSGENMCPEFLTMIDDLRDKCGFPFIISSGYRSPEYNEQVSSSGRTGPHTTGKAADISVYGENAHILLWHATDMEFSGIGISQKGNYKSRFIHLDTLPNDDNHPRPWVWSY